MDIFLFVQIWSSIGLAMAAIGSLYIFYRYMDYPVGDSATLLAYSQALKKGWFLDKFFVVDHGYWVDRETFDNHRRFYSYNLSLNLMRLFPEPIRFRGFQLFNIFLLGLTALVFGLTVDRLAVAGGLPDTAGIGLAVLFAMMLMGRTKLTMLAVCGYPEVVNYVLFCFSIYALQMLDGQSLYWVFFFGGCLGLMVRNMQQYLLNLAGAVAALLLLGASWEVYAVCIGGFALPLADMLWVQFVKKESAFDYLKGILEVYLVRKEADSIRTGQYFRSYVAETVKVVLSPWHDDSFFVSLGGAFYLLPISTIYLLWHGRFGMLETYAFVSGGLTLLFLALVKNEAGRRMTSQRRSYLAFICFQFINASALILAFGQGNGLMLGLFSAYIVLYAIRQLYALAWNHFSDTLRENGLHGQKKIVENYRIEMADFLQKVKRPAVVMGVLLAWGASFRFFQWGHGLRSVELMAPVDDQRILELIDRYGVTHVTRTIIDFPLKNECSLKHGEPTGELGRRLLPYSSTPNLTVWEVIQ